MDAALRALVRERAGHRCEYCRLHEDDAAFLAFHVEHIVAKQHGGTDDPDLLCFACAECNWSKGPNLSGLLAGKLYPLFNPRKQTWQRHFKQEVLDWNAARMDADVMAPARTAATRPVGSGLVAGSCVGSSAADDVAVWVHFLAEDVQLLLGGRGRRL